MNKVIITKFTDQDGSFFKVDCPSLKIFKHFSFTPDTEYEQKAKDKAVELAKLWEVGNTKQEEIICQTPENTQP